MEDIVNNNHALPAFIMEEMLIVPINKIVNNLNNGSYRDCDIKWLDAKLEMYISIAAETLGFKNIITPSDLNKETFTILNKHNTDYYIDKFDALLQYFKSF